MLDLPRKTAALAAGLGLAGCSVIDVVNPPGNLNSGVVSAQAPVTQLQVRLLDRYKANFSATLDGSPIGGFTPAPARNVTVTTQILDCFEGGTFLAPGSHAAKHDFSAQADSLDTSSISATSDTTLFIPPWLVVQPSSGVNLNLNTWRTITVAISPGPTAPVAVRLVPDGPTVSVNGQPAGAVASMTLPTTAAGTFTVTGVSPGNFIVRIRARGVQCDAMSGRVN